MAGINNNFIGLFSSGSVNNSFTDINSSYNLMEGLYFEDSSGYNYLSDINSSNNTHAGLALSYSDKNVIENSFFSANTDYGVHLSYSASNNLSSLLLAV